MQMTCQLGNRGNSQYPTIKENTRNKTLIFDTQISETQLLLFSVQFNFISSTMITNFILWQLTVMYAVYFNIIWILCSLFVGADIDAFSNEDPVGFTVATNAQINQVLAHRFSTRGTTGPSSTMTHHQCFVPPNITTRNNTNVNESSKRTTMAAATNTINSIRPSMKKPATTSTNTTADATITNSIPPSMTSTRSTTTPITGATSNSDATSAPVSLAENSSKEDRQEMDISSTNREEDSPTSKHDHMEEGNQEEDKGDGDQAKCVSGNNAGDNKTSGGDDGHNAVNNPDPMEEDEDGEATHDQDKAVTKFHDKIKKDKLTLKYSVEVFDLLHYHAPMSCCCLGAMLGLTPGSHSLRDPIQKLEQLELVAVVDRETIPDGRDGKPGRKPVFYQLSDAAFPDPTNYRTATTPIPQHVLEAAMKEIKDKNAKEARREKNQKRRREIEDNDNVEEPPAKKSKLLCNCGTLCGKHY